MHIPSKIKVDAHHLYTGSVKFSKQTSLRMVLSAVIAHNTVCKHVFYFVRK